MASHCSILTCMFYHILVILVRLFWYPVFEYVLDWFVWKLLPCIHRRHKKLSILFYSGWSQIFSHSFLAAVLMFPCFWLNLSYMPFRYPRNDPSVPRWFLHRDLSLESQVQKLQGLEYHQMSTPKIKSLCATYSRTRTRRCYVTVLVQYGDGSKPWYLVNPKIAGKWMFIPLKCIYRYWPIPTSG